MVRRWFFYLLTLAACVVFYVANQGWIAWLLLNLVGWFPLLSLAVSLIPMLLVRPKAQIPAAVSMAQPARLGVRIHSPLPLPPCRCRFSVTQTLTGQQWTLAAGDPLPTAHCGQLVCENTAFSVFDFPSFFSLPRKRLPTVKVLVRPEPVTVSLLPALDRFLVNAWVPKYGGGFAENHELRLYRPGDSLNQIHWKLTAKTGKLTIRQPMEPKANRALLTLELYGTDDELDIKLGKLLFLSRYLLERGLSHTVLALTGNGLCSLVIDSEQTLLTALDALLAAPPAPAGTVPPQQAAWQYHIGGDRP